MLKQTELQLGRVNPLVNRGKQVPRLARSKSVSKTYYVQLTVDGVPMIANAIMAKMLVLIRDHGSMSYRELLLHFDEDSDGTVRTYGCRLHRCGVLALSKGPCSIKQGFSVYTRLSLANGVVVGQQVQLLR